MEGAFTSPVRTEYDMLLCAICSVVCQCQLFCSAVSRRYINVCIVRYC